jgi:glycerol uptake facilitator-like aquaporin
MPASLLPALWRSLVVTLRVWWRVIRQLFHEFTGALFLVFAAYGVFVVWREWKHRPGPWVIGFVVIYALMMGAFGFTAFRRARRVR